MIWHVRFSSFAEKDWKSFDRYHQKVIDKAIQKVMQNPTADWLWKTTGESEREPSAWFV